MASKFEIKWGEFICESRENAYESDGDNPDFFAASEALRKTWGERGLQISPGVAARCAELLEERRDRALERSAVGGVVAMTRSKNYADTEAIRFGNKRFDAVEFTQLVVGRDGEAALDAVEAAHTALYKAVQSAATNGGDPGGALSNALATIERVRRELNE